MAVTALWTFAVFLASVFSGLLTGITLIPKYKGTIRAAVWTGGAIIGYGLAFLSYSINLYNDTVGILGLSALVCIISQFLYKDTWSTKLSVSLMACLIANVSTFMFCGTTDTLLAPVLGLIEESPYEVANLLFFIGLKVVIYTALSLLYVKFLKKSIHATIEAVGGKMVVFIPALAVSVVGFYVINLLSNNMGIYPTSKWFFPLYLTLCIIFVIEFWMIFYSINQSANSIKTSAELNIATNIQKSMLPCIFPAFPDREEFDIYATMDAAKEVGGDFYDFFMVDESHLAIVMADVSGKGVPAALFMVIGKTLIKDHTQTGKDLGEVFTEVNNILCESNSEGLFITAFEGVLDLVTGQFNYVNAGHEMPYICRAGEDFEVHKMHHGFVLAGMENMKYRAGSLTLCEGDRIFLYTDGVTEATNAKNELYGAERLKSVLGRVKKAPPFEILPAIKQDIDLFVGSAPQFDDITMLCLEYRGTREVKSLTTKEITLDATIDNIAAVTEFVNGRLAEFNCPKKALSQIAIAIDELFGNIAHYAYSPKVGKATVRVEVFDEPLSVVITFTDGGVPYDPLKKADPDVSLSAKEREIGGLGVYMAKKCMDDISYEYRNGRNILTVRKNI